MMGLSCTLFSFYKNIFRKNIEAEICVILKYFENNNAQAATDFEKDRYNFVLKYLLIQYVQL